MQLAEDVCGQRDPACEWRGHARERHDPGAMCASSFAKGRHAAFLRAGNLPD